MEKYALLLGYYDKQIPIVRKLLKEVLILDVAIPDKDYVFALKVQQLYTALEDLFKQVAKAFENHLDQMGSFHKEILARMALDVPNIRPALLSQASVSVLDRIRAFRHFIRHAYDCALDPKELKLIQKLLETGFPALEKDLKVFRTYIQKLLS